ncbi:MAG: hypothetical protein Q9191_002330 [Dirinaria sp. TL-2023a]
MDRICLRRAGLRVLCLPPLSVPARSRPITTLIRSNPRLNATRTVLSPLQRRWASEDLTQSEPSADRESEAQHGDNAIAKSSGAPASEVDAIESSDQDDSATVTEAVKSTADSVTYRAAQAASGVAAAASGAASQLTGSSSVPQEGSPESMGRNKKTVYVGNIFFDVKEAALEQEFSKAGQVESVKIIRDARGLSKGFAYVEYASEEEADKAIVMLDMQPFEGRRLAVQHPVLKRRQAINRPPRGTQEPARTLFIGNMSYDMSDKDLNDLFREIKNITDVRVAIDRRTGQPRGFAHADFVDIPSAEKAKAELTNKVVNGRNLRVDFSASNRDSKDQAA